MAIEVRRATPDDAETIAGFAMLLFEQHHDYDNDRFAAMSDSKGAAWFYGGRTQADDVAVLIAEQDSRAIGFAYIEFEAMNYGDLLENVAWLHDIYIAADVRGSGAGKKLIAASVKAAKELGADKIVLHVAARNAAGREFFEKVGFRTTMHEMMLGLTKKEVT